MGEAYTGVASVSPSVQWEDWSKIVSEIPSSSNPWWYRPLLLPHSMLWSYFHLVLTTIVSLPHGGEYILVGQLNSLLSHFPKGWLWGKNWEFLSLQFIKMNHIPKYIHWRLPSSTISIYYINHNYVSRSDSWCPSISKVLTCLFLNDNYKLYLLLLFS